MYKLNSWKNDNITTSKIANSYFSTPCGSETTATPCGSEVTTPCGSEIN